MVEGKGWSPNLLRRVEVAAEEKGWLLDFLRLKEEDRHSAVAKGKGWPVGSLCGRTTFPWR